MTQNDARQMFPTAAPHVRRSRDRLAAADSGRAQPVCWVSLGLAAAIDLTAVAMVGVGAGGLTSYLTAGAVHMVAFFVAVGFNDRLEGSRRALAGSLVLALPLAGVALAGLALGTRQRSGLSAAIAPDAADLRHTAAIGCRKIAEALSPCEVLSATGTRDGGAMLAALTRRGDADSVQLLRWLVIADPRMAVEAALALEELTMRFDLGLDARRAALAQTPSAELALAHASLITDALASGLIEPAMLAMRAEEARRCFALATELDPSSAPQTTTEWIRLELAAMRPEAALRLADEALDGGAVAPEEYDHLAELREQARFSAHASLGGGLGSLLQARGARQRRARLSA